MRPIDVYIRQIVTRYPTAPRPCNWWIIIGYTLEAPHIFNIVFMLLMLLLMNIIQGNSLVGDRSQEYTILVICMVCFIVYQTYYVLLFLYQYGYGLIAGCYATAQVLTISTRTQGRGIIAHGIGMVERNTVEQRLAFTLDSRVCGAWFDHITPGDTLHILMHPRKPIILIVFGIAGKNSNDVQHLTNTSPSGELLSFNPKDMRRQYRRTHPGYLYIITLITVTLLFFAGPLLLKIIV